MSGQPLSIAVLISTYNRPDALALVLSAILGQNRTPDEIVIADDGSGEETRKLIEKLASTSAAPIKHVWHSDNGFRVSAIRNRAISVIESEYILQIDGDILLHRASIGAHLHHARKNCFVQGSRALLGKELTSELIREKRWSPGLLKKDMRHRINGVHLPLLTPLFTSAPRDPLKRVRGCHLAYWREDAVRINGYNETMTGWGLEDSEFVARLHNSGIQRRAFKFGAPAWHLWHAQHTRERVSSNLAIYEHTINSVSTWCEAGISGSEFMNDFTVTNY